MPDFMQKGTCYSIASLLYFVSHLDNLRVANTLKQEDINEIQHFDYLRKKWIEKKEFFKYRNFFTQRRKNSMTVGSQSTKMFMHLKAIADTQLYRSDTLSFKLRFNSTSFIPVICICKFCKHTS